MNEEQITREIQSLRSAVDLLTSRPVLLDHYHNGFDASKVRYADIDQRKHWIPWTIPGAQAATATNYGTFFINEMGPCFISGFWEIHQVMGSDAGAVTVELEKLTGTTAPDSGSSVLSAVLSLKTTANTLQAGTITSTLGNKNLALGDRLCLKDAGVLTAVSNVSVLVELTMT